MRNTTHAQTVSRAAVAARPKQFQFGLIILVVICTSIVAAGFFFAARQHFMSMEFGIKNSKLRQQLDDLEAERRRLVVAREVAVSPMAIKRASRSIGIVREQTDAAPVLASAKKPAADKIAPTQVAATDRASSSNGPRIVRTSVAAPSRNNAANNETRSRVVDNPGRRSRVVATIAKLN